MMDFSSLDKQPAIDEAGSLSAAMSSTPDASDPETSPSSLNDDIDEYIEPINRGKRIVDALTELHIENHRAEVKSKLYAVETLKLLKKNPSMQAIEEKLGIYSKLLAIHQKQHCALNKLQARLEELLLDVTRQMGRAEDKRELKLYEYILEAILESIHDGEVQYLQSVTEVVKALGEEKAEQTKTLIEKVVGTTQVPAAEEWLGTA